MTTSLQGIQNNKLNLICLIPGCKLSSECNKGYKCDTNKGQCELDTCLLPISNSSNVVTENFDSISRHGEDVEYLKLSCLEQHALFDAGMIQNFKGIMHGQIDTHTTLECDSVDGSRYWKTAQGGKLFYPNCKPMPGCDCLKGEICKKGQCLPLCEIDVLKQKGLEVTLHLESDPNYPKHCCDESYVNGNSQQEDTSHLYVPAGDVIRIGCKSKNQRLILNSTYHTNGSDCFGDFLDYVCFKIGNHQAEWRTLSDPRNDKLPICVKECKKNNYCPSFMHCDVENCGTCVNSQFEPCNINEDCVKNTQAEANETVLDTRPKQCLLNPITNDLRCMPSCPSTTANTIFDDPNTLGTTRASCKFHYEFDRTGIPFSSGEKRVPFSLDIYCDRSKYEPLWMVKTANPFPLPPCNFVTTYCSEESLQTTKNGAPKFTPGRITGEANDDKVEPHTARVKCNENGYFMTIEDNIWRGKRLNNSNTCQRDLDLVCGSLNETRYWQTIDHELINVDDISCSQGCVQDEDCKLPHSYCNHTTCGCEQHQCPDKIDNGVIGCLCCHVGFENIFYCDKGYTVAHPDYIVYWYLDCMNETTDCTTNQMRTEVDIRCNFDPKSSRANWYLDYHKIFDGATHKQFFNITVPAKCVKGCENDENCPYGEECVVREDDDCSGDEKCNYACSELGDCPPGVCVPYRCKDYTETWGGRLVGKNFSTIGQKATFECKEGYFMPNLIDVLNNNTSSKPANTQVMCQKVTDSLIPEWRLSGENLGKEIPQCYKDCRVNEDCDPRDECNLRYGNGACLPKQCPSEVSHGMIKRTEVAVTTEDIEPEFTMICHREYIILSEVNSVALRSHLVECRFNVSGGDHMKWVHKEVKSSKLQTNKTSKYLESKCQSGCLDDEDCSEYGTECSQYGPSRHTCVLKKCPTLHVSGGKVDVRERVVKDSVQLECLKGHIYKNSVQNIDGARKYPVKNSTLLCTLNIQKSPIWVEEQFSQTEFRGECIEGCMSCLDCNTDENCVKGRCEKIRCSIHEDETVQITEDVDIGSTSIAIAKDTYIFNLFDGEEMKCRKSSKIICDFENSNYNETNCTYRKGVWQYKPLQISNITYSNSFANKTNFVTQEIPSIHVGCAHTSATRDCDVFEHCNNCKCERTMCATEIKNGHLKMYDNQGGDDKFSGQNANLVCEPSYFLKVFDTNMVLNGNLSNETSVVCKYIGRDARWIDTATEQEVTCNKECLKDDDCTQKDVGFCINHRCKPSCCQLSELVSEIGNQELCQKMLYADEKCIQVPSVHDSHVDMNQNISANEYHRKIEICCLQGFVMRTDDKAKLIKSTNIQCSREQHGAVFRTPHGQIANKSTCVPGCVDKDDCELGEKCSKEGVCKTKTCKYPRGLVGDVILQPNCHIGDDNRAELGCNATFLCHTSNIYFNVITKFRSRGVKVQCIDNPNEDEGIWKTIPNHNTLQQCIEGCLSSDDCTANGMTPCRECHGENFNCVEKQCHVSDPNVEFNKQATTCPVDAMSESCETTNIGTSQINDFMTKGSSGIATCKRGYVFFLDNQSAKKSLDLQCCDKNSKNKVCELDWGLNPDCTNTSVQCVKGCVPKTSTNNNSDDCELEETCVNNKCIPKLCQLPNDRKYNIQSSNPNATEYFVGSSHELCCDFGYVFYLHSPMKTKCVSVSCQIDDTNLEAKFKTNPAYGSLPDCQKGCVTDNHCRNSTHDQSICHNGTCAWPCEAIESVENGDVSISSYDLGSEAQIVCSKGYLINEDSQRNATLSCVYQVGEGSRWCRLDTGVCEVPACTRGCLDKSDCGAKEVCKVSRQVYKRTKYESDKISDSYGITAPCTHSMCCEKIVCPSLLSGLNGYLELEYSNTELGSYAKFQCNKDATYPPLQDQTVSSKYLEPKSWVALTCVRIELEDEHGTWVAFRDGDIEPIQACETSGCNLGDRSVMEPCYYCRQDIWKIAPKSCLNSIGDTSIIDAPNKELGSSGTILCKENTFLQPFNQIKDENGRPLKSAPILCECGTDIEPQWQVYVSLSNDTVHSVRTTGCDNDKKPRLCLSDKDCQDRSKFCNTSINRCENTKCSKYISDSNTELVLETSTMNNKVNDSFNNSLQLNNEVYNGEISLAKCTKQGYFFRNFENGKPEASSEIQVRCCYSEESGKRIWVEEWTDPKYCGEKEAKCELPCWSSKDCPIGFHCSVGLTKGTSRCEISKCENPLVRKYGHHLDFPTGGFEEGEGSSFKCNEGYAMKPKDDRKLHRKEVFIYCVLQYSPERGYQMGYSLENGARVTDCEENGCENSNQCKTDAFCHDGICTEKQCNKVSYSQNSELTTKVNSIREEHRLGKIGADADLSCHTGHVTKIIGKCQKTLRVSCNYNNGVNDLPFWSSTFETIHHGLPNCVRGCESNSDCGVKAEFCDINLCQCRKKLCENSNVRNGVIQVHIDGEIRNTGTLICDFGYTPICKNNSNLTNNLHHKADVVCTDINPRPEWRTSNEGCIPECINIHENFNQTSQNNTQICSRSIYHKLVAGRCIPKECAKPSIENGRIVALSHKNSHQYVIGRIISVVCNDGYVYLNHHSGNIPNKEKKLVCRYNEDSRNSEFIPLDGSLHTTCVPGKYMKCYFKIEASFKQIMFYSDLLLSKLKLFKDVYLQEIVNIMKIVCKENVQL